MLLKKHRRAGVTLIEILVVIAIIVILVSLLMAGVMRARIAGVRTENATRIQEISEAITRCKGDLKLSYIPSEPINTTVPPGSAGPPLAPVGFLLRGKYIGNEPELRILLRAFPNMNTYANQLAVNPALTLAAAEDNGYTGPDVLLDANQVLTFFLAGVGDQAGTTNFGMGFSNNPKKPFTPVQTAAETRKGPWVQNNLKYFALPPPTYAPYTPTRPWLIDVRGNPFAYFAAIDGKTNNYYKIPATPPTTPQTYTTQTFTFGAGTISPFQSPGSTPANLKFINENGFQIISAGYDKVFGVGGTDLPAHFAGEDDQANFSKTLLGGVN